jgi:glutamate--cysteine ligase
MSNLDAIRPDFSKTIEPLMGIEIEMFGFDSESLAPLGTPGARVSSQQLMERISASQGTLKRDSVTGEIIGLDLGCGNFSLEPGGQLEYASCPGLNLRGLLDDLRTGLSILEEAGRGEILFLDHGTNPLAGADLPLLVPKHRYKILDRYFSSQPGGRGVHMMRYSATAQPNVDVPGGLQEWQDAINLTLALTPAAKRLFSNSFFFQGQAVRSSERQRIWDGIDASRTGVPPVAFQPDIAAAYAAWGRQAGVFLAGDLPLEQQPRYGELSWEQWEKSGWHGSFPSESDWETHLGTLFPDLRLRRFLEIRMCDAQTFAHALAPMAFWAVALREGRARLWQWLELKSESELEMLDVVRECAEDELARSVLGSFAEYKREFKGFEGSAADFVRSEGTLYPSRKLTV